MSVKRTKNGELYKRIENLNDSRVAVGWFKETEPYPDGKRVAEVAYDNEFGNRSRGVPQRSFFRTTIHANENQWVKLCSKLLKSGLPMPMVLETMGGVIQGDVQEKIYQIAAAGGNSERTIARKGFDAPLIDTSHMVKTISYKVGVENEQPA